VTFHNLRKKTKAILLIQMVGMLMGTSTHVMWAIRNGFLSEQYNAPLLSQIFWDSLTYLDPLAALLLFLKPKAGVYLTLVIILVDIVHNNIFYMDELYLNAPALSEWIVRYWMILGQIVFGVFVVLTFKGNLTEIKRCKELT
jgi:hypothetical protein